VSASDSNPTIQREQPHDADSVMTERDYVTSSKYLLYRWNTAIDSVNSLARIIGDLLAKNLYSPELDGQWRAACDYEFDKAGEWLELAYKWIEANNCSAESVRRVFDDLFIWYLPSLGDDVVWPILQLITKANWEDHSPSFRPGHAAILRHMPYAWYLKTNHWNRLRDKAHERAGNRCQVCNAGGLLDVHHRTYERRGAELPEDLIVLCRSCHETFHKNGRLAR
jgi:hypothetical protein